MVPLLCFCSSSVEVFSLALVLLATSSCSNKFLKNYFSRNAPFNLKTQNKQISSFIQAVHIFKEISIIASSGSL